VDCPACADRSKANTGGRQVDGFREWTAEFRMTENGWWPIESLPALRCPDCGERGRVWSY
jgi:hypothetical protein